MSKPKLNGLGAERAELEAIREDRTGRADAVRQARVALIQQQELVEQARTPRGILAMSDEQIAAAEKKQRDCLRQLAKAEAELAEYERGPAKDLERRMRDLERREWEQEHAETLAACRAKVAEYLAACAWLSSNASATSSTTSSDSGSR